MPRSYYRTLTLLALLNLVALGAIPPPQQAHAQPQAGLLFTSFVGQPSDDHLTVRLFLQAEQEDFQLGSASFVFDFNAAGLSFPSGSNATRGTDYSFADPFASFPYNSLVTQPTAGKIQVEVTYAYSFIGACQGTAVTTSATIEIAEVVFTISDPSQTAGLLWDGGLTRVFDDGSLASPDAPTTCDDAATVEATEIPLGTLLGDDVFLPVELTAFEAQVHGGDVLLRWSTASETNNAGFKLEHRTHDDDAAEGTWQTLAWIEGHGTTGQAQSYAFRAADLSPGRHVFRLKQVDYDGAFEYSPEVEVGIAVPARFLLTSAYPNPFNPQTSFSLAVAVAQEVQVAVYNVLGRRVAVLHEGRMQANQARSFVWEASSQPSGLYFLRIVGEQFAETQQVTLVK